MMSRFRWKVKTGVVGLALVLGGWHAVAGSLPFSSFVKLSPEPDATISLSLFGGVVAADQGIVAIGYPRIPGDGPGEVVIYEEGLVEPVTLKAPAGAISHFFGIDLALEGDRLVVLGSKVHTYRRVSAGNWIEISALALEANGLAMDEDLLAVKAGKDLRIYQPGTDGSVWAEAAIIPSPLEVGVFGTSLAVDEDTVIVGATGLAFVYRPIGGVWTEIARLVEPDHAAGSDFGRNVEVERGIAFVSAPNYGPPALQTGAVFAFASEGTGPWTLVAEIYPRPGKHGESFGTNVLAQENRIFIGAHSFDARQGVNAGAVYEYERGDPNGYAWSFVNRLLAPDPQYEGRFGESVSVFDDLLVVGGTGVDGVGAVYLFTDQ